jgi:hypothetical protein
VNLFNIYLVFSPPLGSALSPKQGEISGDNEERAKELLSNAVAGTHFTCFTGTKVQKLTQKAVQSAVLLSLLPGTSQLLRRHRAVTRLCELRSVG